MQKDASTDKINFGGWLYKNFGQQHSLSIVIILE